MPSAARMRRFSRSYDRWRSCWRRSALCDASDRYAHAVAGGVPLTDVYSGGYSLLNWAKLLEGMADGTLPLVYLLWRKEVIKPFGCSVVSLQRLIAAGYTVIYAQQSDGNKRMGDSEFHSADKSFRYSMSIRAVAHII